MTAPHPQVHLVTCSAFLSSANKAEFLDLGYVSGAGAGGRPVHPAAVPVAPHHISPLPFSN